MTLLVRTFVALCVLVAALPAAAQTADEPKSDLGFLETGRDYVIRFPPSHEIFKTTQSGISQSTYTTEGGEEKPGRPVTWTMTYNIQAFHVVKLGSGSWALLRHPADVEDANKWFGMRRAMAMLTPEKIAELEASAEGKEKLEKLREAASREIKTTDTWINLHHAIAIADVPTDEIELKINVKATPSK